MTLPYLKSSHDSQGAAIAPTTFNVINLKVESLRLVPDTEESWGLSPFELMPKNRVVEFEGDIYIQHNFEVWKSLGSTGVYTSETNMAGLGGNDPAQWGLFVVNVTGVPKLYAFGSNTNLRTIGWRYKESRFFGNGLWTTATDVETDSTVPNSLTAYHHAELIFNNRWYIQTLGTNGSFGNLRVFDFEANSMISMTHSSGASFPNGANLFSHDGMCAYKNEVYQLIYEQPLSTGVGWNLYLERVTEGASGGIALILASGMVTHQIMNDGGRNTMWVDDEEDKMYVLSYINGSGVVAFGGQPTAAVGWTLWEVEEENGVLKNRGTRRNTLLGTNAYPTVDEDVAPGFGSSKQRYISYNFVDASGNNQTLIEYSDDGEEDTANILYRWNGPDLPMTQIGVGGNATDSKPLVTQGGGEVIWNDRKPFDLSLSIEPDNDLGVMRLKFHIIGGTGQLCDVGFFFDKEGGPPTNRATITQANSGTLANNIITGIQAVSGFQYEVLWQLQDDGVGVGENFAIFPAAIAEFN